MDINRKFVVRGTKNTEENMLRQILLGDFTVSMEALKRTKSHITKRDPYQLCYSFGSLLLLSKQILDEHRVYEIRSLGRFPNAHEFFEANRINASILQHYPNEATLTWFQTAHRSEASQLRPCLISFGSILASFLPDFEGASIMSWDLKAGETEETNDDEESEKLHDDEVDDIFSDYDYYHI
ncbi:hypothetical protein [Parasitella parasitica]|uniref:Uncharacterized protein n=1 Tax=Parasitella parasitica TaxID=35722 RepID=A0A0B7NRR8_9FUNG|nr:hypothetical protein [Parasitella parasitica]